MSESKQRSIARALQSYVKQHRWPKVISALDLLHIQCHDRYDWTAFLAEGQGFEEASCKFWRCVCDALHADEGSIKGLGMSISAGRDPARTAALKIASVASEQDTQISTKLSVCQVLVRATLDFAGHPHEDALEETIYNAWGFLVGITTNGQRQSVEEFFLSCNAIELCINKLAEVDRESEKLIRRTDHVLCGYAWMMPLRLLTHLSRSPRFSAQSGLYTHERLPCVLASILEKAAREHYDVSCPGLAEALDFIKIYATRASLTSQFKNRISTALDLLRAPNPDFRLTYVGGEPDWQAAFVEASAEGTQVVFAGELCVSQGFDCACGLISVFLRCGLFAAVEPHHALLCPDVLHAGCNVQLVGLQGKVELNGRTGCCHSWDRSRQSWQVKLQDAVSAPILVCPRNLLLLGVDASPFPFQGRNYKLEGQTIDRRQQLSCDESFLYKDELQYLSEAGADQVQIPAAEAVGKIKRAMHLDAVADALCRGSALSLGKYEEDDAQEHPPDMSLVSDSLRGESFQLRKIVWAPSRIYYARSALEAVRSEQDRNPSQVLAELRDVPDPQDCILTCARLNRCRAVAYANLDQFVLATEKLEQALVGFTECLNDIRFSPVRRKIRLETLVLRMQFAELCESSILTWEQILQAIDEHFPDGEMLGSKYQALYSIGRIRTDEGNYYLEATRKVAELAQLSRADATAMCNILRFQLSGYIAQHKWRRWVLDQRSADEHGRHVPREMHEAVINGVRFFEEAKLARESSALGLDQVHYLVVLQGLVIFYEQLHACGVSDKNGRRLKYALAIHAHCTASLGTEDAHTCHACIDLGKAFRDLGDTPAARKFLKLGRGIAQLRGLRSWETLAHDALQELAPGEAVAKSRLFMPEVMQNKCDNPMCRNIDTPASRFQKCSGCLVARYCSQGCQTEAYTAHKKLCKKLRLTKR